MQEISRIIIEEYCWDHPDTKKSKFLEKMVKLSYDEFCDPSDRDAVILAQYIAAEEDSELKEALEDMDEFLFRY